MPNPIVSSFQQKLIPLNSTHPTAIKLDHDLNLATCIYILTYSIYTPSPLDEYTWVSAW